MGSPELTESRPEAEERATRRGDRGLRTNARGFAHPGLAAAAKLAGLSRPCPRDYRWLCARVAVWHDPRYITRLTQEYVDRLLALKRSGEALDVVAARLTEDSGFRPKSAVATLQIARLAAAGGGTQAVARTLLGDFSTRYCRRPLRPRGSRARARLGSLAHQRCPGGGRRAFSWCLIAAQLR